VSMYNFVWMCVFRVSSILLQSVLPIALRAAPHTTPTMHHSRPTPRSGPSDFPPSHSLLLHTHKSCFSNAESAGPAITNISFRLFLFFLSAVYLQSQKRASLSVLTTRWPIFSGPSPARQPPDAPPRGREVTANTSSGSPGGISQLCHQFSKKLHFSPQKIRQHGFWVTVVNSVQAFDSEHHHASHPHATRRAGGRRLWGSSGQSSQTASAAPSTPLIAPQPPPLPPPEGPPSHSFSFPLFELIVSLPLFFRSSVLGLSRSDMQSEVCGSTIGQGRGAGSGGSQPHA